MAAPAEKKQKRNRGIDQRNWEHEEEPEQKQEVLKIYDDRLPDLCLFWYSYGAVLTVLARIVNDWLIVQVQPKECSLFTCGI